jgi:hypothetical protein
MGPVTLKKCPQCQSDVSVLAKKCPHCRSKLPQRMSSVKIVLLGVLGLGILTQVILSNLTGFNVLTPPQPSPEVLRQRETLKKEKLDVAYEVVKTMIEGGFIYKVEPSEYRVYINEGMWADLPIDKKEAYIEFIGMYIQDQNSDTLGINVFGAYSGLKIATWNDYGGLNLSR